jgi:dihydrofolate reductase
VLSIICAVARNGVIGRGGRLPWHLPDDLAHFKRVTLGRPVIMGRRTWESLPRALPGRRNLVVTRAPGYAARGAEVFASLDAALATCGEASDPVVIGGAELYAEALPRARRIYLTRVNAEVEGDVYFPPFPEAEYAEIERIEHAADARHAFAFSIATLERRAQEVQP